jgi:ATP-dependent protease HslVU (ClpYQ) peptidase subunit
VSTATDPADALASAEDLVAQLEHELRQFARSLVARAVEVAEDIWAEAESERSGLRPDR